MNENARKWVSALRSGEYSQDSRYLRTDKGFCCLGVACDVYSKETGEGEWGSTPWRWRFGTSKDEQETAGLPVYVMEWLGLRDQLGGCLEKMADTYASLSSMNDAGKTFSEIADIIESEPETLFA